MGWKHVIVIRNLDEWGQTLSELLEPYKESFTNDDSKWDWYESSDKLLINCMTAKPTKSCRVKELGFNYEFDNYDDVSIVTPDGEWHDRDDCDGWFGIVYNSADFLFGFIKLFPPNAVVDFVDYHI